MSGSSSGQTPATTTQSKDPWSGAVPYINQALTTAQSNFQNNIGYQPYAGQTQAPLDPNVSAGLGGITSIAQNTLGGTPGIQAAQNLGLQQIQEAGGTNPYLENILNTNNRRIGDRIDAAMSGAGRYGSGQHTDVMARALAESADPILAQDYTQGLQRAGQWAQLMPTLDQAQYAPAQQLMAAGQYTQDRAQAQLNDQIKMYNAQQSYPWEQLARYNAIIQGTGGLGGTSVSASTPYQPSTMQRLLGGAMAGGALGGSFGGLPGAGLGALGGGLLGGIL